jgi:hypothetical protein
MPPALLALVYFSDKVSSLCQSQPWTVIPLPLSPA